MLAGTASGCFYGRADAPSVCDGPKLPPRVRDRALDAPLAGATTPDATTLRRLSDRGPILVSFDNDGCKPCRSEEPLLLAARRRGLRVIVLVPPGGAPKDDPARFDRWLHGEILARIDVTGLAIAGLTVRTYPRTYLIGRGGSLLASRVGLLRPPDVDRFLRLAR